MSTPNTLVTFQQFMSIEQSSGTFNVWTDILAKEWKQNLVNEEVLGAPVYFPKEYDGIGDNIELQIQVIPGVNYLNASNLEAQNIKTHKVMAHISTDYEGSFQNDIRDKKSSIDWSKYISNEVSGIYKRRSDQNNLIAMETMINTCLATGNYIIDPVVGGSGYSKEEYYDASQRMVAVADKLVSLRTKYHLGTPVERIKLLLSYKANQNLVLGSNFLSAANLSLEKYAQGKPGNVMGYENARTIYLGTKVDALENAGETTERRLYAKGFDFTNYSALIYQLDSLRVYGHVYNEVLENIPTDPITKKINKVLRLYTFIWRINALVYPGFEPLNKLVCSVAPTLEQVNAARAALRTEQPGLYNQGLGTDLPDITQETLDAWNEANDNYSTRVVIESTAGDVMTPHNLFDGQSVNIDAPIATSGSEVVLAINSIFRDMSFDLDSIKYYGGTTGKVTITPISNTEIKIASTDTLTADTDFFTINVKRGGKVFGTIFNIVKASA